MTGYQIALFVHLTALLAATAASGIVHLASARRKAAPTLRQSMEWGRLLGSTARVFPFAVITLLLTGAYMVTDRWSWHTGWVEAGIAGALLLLASGATIGMREGAGARASVARLQSAGRDLPNDAAPDPVAVVLGEANTGLALALVLVMTIKPGLAGSLAVLAIGAAAGAYRARGHLRAKAPAAAIAEAEAA